MPPAFLIMKLISSGVTSCAAQMRSPSFSRSSSSATMTSLPAANVGDRLFYGAEWHGVSEASEYAIGGHRAAAYGATSWRTYLPDHVGLDVHARRPTRERAQRGVRARCTR